MSSFSYTSGCTVPSATGSRFVLYSSSTVKNRSGMALVAALPGSALTSSTWPPDSVSIRIPAELPPWLVKPAPARSMYQGTFCIESVAPWIATKPPPARMYACRFVNSVKLRPAAFRPTVELNTIVLYWLSVAGSRNGFVVSETPAGACHPVPG